jgi:hypothetical protein
MARWHEALARALLARDAPMRTMTTSSFAGSGDRDVPQPSAPQALDFLFRLCFFLFGPSALSAKSLVARAFPDFAYSRPPFTGIYRVDRMGLSDVRCQAPRARLIASTPCGRELIL